MKGKKNCSKKMWATKRRRMVGSEEKQGEREWEDRGIGRSRISLWSTETLEFRDGDGA